jgi:DNA primase
MALAPAVLNQAAQVRQELMVTRLAHRLGLRQETVWARLAELKAERRRREPEPVRASMATSTPVASGSAPLKRGGPAPEIERQLLQLLLAEPELVPMAAASVQPEQLSHSGLRRMLMELYSLHQEGLPVDLDGLRLRMIDRPDLVQVAVDLQFVGRHANEREIWLNQVITRFADRRVEAERRDLQAQLSAGPSDDGAAVDLLRQLQQKTRNGTPGSSKPTAP